MTSRSGRRRVDHSSPLVDLDDVFADDAFIDAFATRPWGPDAGPWETDDTAGGGFAGFGRHRTPGTVDTAEPLTELFGNWRRELAQTPIPDVPAIPTTIEVAGRPKPKRSHRPALAVAAAIAALLVGSTFVGSRQATEGSALWNVTAVLWPDRVESVASRDKVRSAIEVAQVALKENRPADAQAALLDASFEIGKVDDADGRQDLQSSLEGLWKQAAPASTSASSAEHRAAGGSPTSTTPAATTTAPQQVAAVVSPLVPPPALTGAQIAAPDPASTGQGSTGSAEVIGGSPGAGVVPSLSTGEAAAVIAAAPTTGTGTGTEEPVSGSDAPATSEPPATPLSPSTGQPTAPSPTNSTEPAPAPKPSLPTSTMDVPGTADSAGQSADALTAESSAIDTAASTAVLPTP